MGAREGRGDPGSAAECYLRGAEVLGLRQAAVARARSCRLCERKRAAAAAAWGARVRWGGVCAMKPAGGVTAIQEGVRRLMLD